MYFSICLLIPKMIKYLFLFLNAWKLTDQMNTIFACYIRILIMSRKPELAISIQNRFPVLTIVVNLDIEEINKNVTNILREAVLDGRM